MLLLLASLTIHLAASCADMTINTWITCTRKCEKTTCKLGTTWHLWEVLFLTEVETLGLG